MTREKDSDRVVIQNCMFHGPTWEGDSVQALLFVAEGLRNLTKVFDAAHLQALLMVNPECECKENEDE